MEQRFVSTFSEENHAMKYVLLPTVCIKTIDGGFSIRNAVARFGGAVRISSMEQIRPCGTFMENDIFCTEEEVPAYKNWLFNYLEMKYRRSKCGIGYIETTSICPYSCKMCPKGTNNLVRSMAEMPLYIFRNIVDSIDLKDVTLHLFGDPLYDVALYERIAYLNKKNITPSFSTNLISLMRLDWDSILNIKMNVMTISIDTLDASSLSGIRGRTSESDISNSLECLRKLAKLNQKKCFINSIIAQSIRLRDNAKYITGIQKILNSIEGIEFYEKPYIKFPGVIDNELNGDVMLTGNEWMWIYNILNTRLPFRCFKPWRKSEMGVLSDGGVVPCCMCFNETFAIGNICNESLRSIQDGIQFYKFRKNIFNHLDCGPICNKCTQSGASIVHNQINKNSLEQLSRYCMDHW